MKKIQVMIVEDSRVIRQFLEHIIGGDPRLEVVASVESAEEALRQLARLTPDVISMDVHLPGMNGVEATRRIMEQQPTPIVIVSGSLDSAELQSSMNALEAGALAVIEKPVGTTHDDYEAMAQRLCTQLAIMSQVKVIRQRFNQRRRVLRAGRAKAVRGEPSGPIQMIGVVSSTGGPSALQTIFGSLPAEFPVPIALVQHITASFHQSFVEWLNRNCALPVVAAKAGTRPQPGYIYVAPPDHHLLVKQQRFKFSHSEPVSAQRPSGTLLLESVARDYGSSGMGIVLTGMGNDGARGLYKLREAGGYTIAEDESTAVVYGMPAAAARLGAAYESLPLHVIARRVVEVVTRKTEENPWNVPVGS